jgi:acetolactate synthase-1/2/3 large subunit
LVIAGGGGWSVESARALETFADHWHLPVGCAFRFQDTFDNYLPQYAGDVGIGINPKLAQRIAASDLIIAIGPRLGEMTTNGYELIKAPMPSQKLVHFHSSAEELGRVYQAHLSINATMNVAAVALKELMPPKPEKIVWRDWTNEIHQEYLANLIPQTLPGRVDMARIMKVVSECLPQDAVLTNGAGNFASWLHRFHRYHGLSKGFKTQLAPTSGAMGYGVPAGIAANILSKRVGFTIAGDGDFLMTGQELATAVQFGAKTIILLLNNGIYGTIRMHQEREYPTHVSGSSLRNPDFVKLAEAYGYVGVKVTSTEEFESLFKAALLRDQGTLIEVVLDPEVITTRISLSQIRSNALAK